MCTRTTMLVFSLSVLAAPLPAGEPPALPAAQAPDARELKNPRDLVAAMETSFAAVDDYRCHARLHVVNGDKRTDRDATFYFRKPHAVLLQAGRLGVLFRDDGKIRGWFVARWIGHEHKPEDAVLYDVRGRRFDHYAFGDVIAELKTMLDHAVSAKVEASPESPSRVLLTVVPSGEHGLSRRVYAVDPKWRLPVAWESFDSDAKVESVDCDELAVNVGLKPGLFR